MIAAPITYVESLSLENQDLKISTTVPLLGSVEYDAVQIFVRNQLDVIELAPSAPAVLKKNGLLWFTYPSENSGLDTDINSDVGWESLIQASWDPVEQLELDDIWASLRFEFHKG